MILIGKCSEASKALYMYKVFIQIFIMHGRFYCSLLTAPLFGLKGGRTPPTHFLLMVAMHDYYYCILTGASPLQHKDKYLPNLGEISGPGYKTL